jgi:phenylalanyl-tRNA synthetase beta chain
VRRTLLSAGFNEAIASTFCSAGEAALTAPQPGLVVALGNPLSEEAGVLRPSLIPGMLAMVAGNLHRDVNDVRLFEVGTVFSGTTEKVEERPALALSAAGSLPERSALHPPRTFEFHDFKGAVEQVLSRFEAHSIYFDRFPPEAGLTPAWLHPWRSARAVVEGVTVGWFGQLHPREAAARKLKDPVFIGEMDLGRLYKLPLRRPAGREISRFQPVRRDFSLIAGEGVPWESIDRSLAALAIPELVDWNVREVFRDARLGAGEYALLMGTTFQAPDRTLREEELQSFQTRIIQAVGMAGARLRT